MFSQSVIFVLQNMKKVALKFPKITSRFERFISAKNASFHMPFHCQKGL